MDIDSCQGQHQLLDGALGRWRRCGREAYELTTLRQTIFGVVGQKAVVAHPHEALGDDVEQKAADELLGTERHQLAPILVFSIAVSEGNFTVVARADAIIGKRHAVGVASEIIEDMGSRAERFFGIDDPRFFSQSFQQHVKAFSIG